MFSHRRFASTLLLLSLIFTASFPKAAFANYPPSDNFPAVLTGQNVLSNDSKVLDHLTQQARQLGSVRVIVRLNMVYQPEGDLVGPQAVASQRNAIQHTQAALLQRLGAEHVSSAKRFQMVPYLALSVDEQSLELLKTLPEVASVEEDLPVPPTLSESVSLIGATPAQTGGYTGLGQSVAILDTGVDKTHPFLTGKVVSEACYSSTDSYYGSTTVCPDGSESSTAIGSGVNCTVDEGCNHGTHVAGIAAGKGAAFSGVASDASVIAIQVFSRFNSSTYCGGDTPPCVLSYTSDQILALEHVYELRSQYNIAAVNMSLGSSQTYTSNCDSDNLAMKAAIDNLRSAGIATVIASGNSYASTGLSSPACISTAVSVGSTLDGGSGAVPVDTVSSFSNSASFLSLLAPGQLIYSSIPGGMYATYQGTSMAAPHVTGAWAVLKSKFPAAAVPEVLTALTSSGKPVTDTRNSITKPRIQVDAALNLLSVNAPSVSGFSPYSGPVGTPVEIYGLHFETATSVNFNGTLAADFEIVSPSHIRAILPPAAATGKITVTSPDGYGSSVSSFQVGDNPVSYPLMNTAINGTAHSALAWADYDNDGNLDVLTTGEDNGGPVTRLYRGDGTGGFSLVDAGLPGVGHGNAAWVDFDNDNDLDLLLTGAGTSNTGTQLYRNQGGSLTEVSAGLPSMSYAAADWGDYDLDGDLDLALSGQIGKTEDTLIYRNDGNGVFTAISDNLVGVKRGSLNWVDYDNDSDPDLFITGQQGTTPLAKLYRNDGGGAFVDSAVTFTAVYDGSSDWGDFDSDGDLDLLLSGVASTGPVIKVFRNNATGSFTSITINIPAVSTGTAAWGDYENDGDLDILLAGSSGVMPIAAVYKNQSGTFSGAYVPLHGIQNGQAAWGDYDGDQDLDIFLLGDTLAGPQAFLYRNDSLAVNTPPSAPGSLTYSQGENVTLQWNAAGDGQTPAAGLTYNLRVGRTPGGSEVIAPEADLSSGKRRLPALGNVGQGTNTLLKNLTPGTYYWAVQSLDASLAGSPFSPESTLVVAGRVAFKSATTQVAESSPSARFEVVLDSEGSTPVTVDYSVVGETAIPGNDYIPASGKLTFAPGETSQAFSVEILDDTQAESDETFLLKLANPTGNIVLGSPGQARATILDDDGFVNSGILLPGGGNEPSAAWGDYDNDGDLDVVLSGYTNSQNVARIYRNNQGSFTDAGAGLPSADYAYFDWADYDNDGDLDLLYSGRSSGSTYFTRIYRNSSGVFTDISAGLPGYSMQNASWADYDIDGDLDLLLVSSSATTLYQNNNGTFSPVPSGLPTVSAVAAWADYDKDGYPDLALTGLIPSTSTPIARVYRNNRDGTFTDINAGLLGASGGTAAWGDYDNDGYLDLLVSGFNSGSRLTNLYRNNGNSTFTKINAGLPGAGNNQDASCWGDYDNDGDLDLLLVGIYNTTTYIYEARVYRNDGGGVFTDIQTNLQGSNWSPGSWGDYDNDGDLDLILLDSGTSSPAARIYQNRTVHKNTPPSAPGNLSYTHGNDIVLHWDPAADGQTPAAGLTYNVRVGRSPGGADVIAPQANLANGYRQVPEMGRVGTSTSAAITGLTQGTYYWAVQAVDSALAGSPFSAEGTFVVPPDAHFETSTYSFGEEAGQVKVVVTLSSPVDEPATVDYATAGDTAVAGNDFTPVSGTLTFAAGEISKTITIEILEDGLTELNDSFLVNLSSPSDNIMVGDPGQTRINIIDNDGFVESGLLPGGGFHSSAWGDYDNDHDLDLAISGYVNSQNVVRIYRNDGSSFTDINAGLPGADYTYLDWADYDNDGDLDLLYYGRQSGGAYYTRIYRNVGGTFTDINAGLTASSWQHNSFADYDNDGDLDLLIVNGINTVLYRNNGGTFSQVSGTSFPALSHGPAAWGDYDNDGDLDLLLTGWSDASYFYGGTSRIYRNDGNGTFTDINAGLLGVTDGAAAWGDYDNDGDLDVLIAGCAEVYCPNYYTRIYRNNGNSTFSDINAGLPGSGHYSTSQFGDFDNDGDLDVIITSINDDTYIPAATIYRNDGGSFVALDAGLSGSYWGPGTWADYDNDNDLDLILFGTYMTGYGSHLYKNTKLVKNTVPSAPGNPGAVVTESAVTLSWSASVDNQTPQAALTYNLRVGTYPGGSNIVSPMADPVTGYRSIPAMGNVSVGTTAILKSLAPNRTYYWAVQAIDGAYAGSPFSVERTFTTPAPAISFASSGVSVNETQSQVSVTVQLSTAASFTTTVQYATSDGTATAGSDYTAASGTLTFYPGETVKTVLVSLTDDAIDEADETIRLTLSNPTNGVLGAGATADITILDNDASPAVRLAAGTNNVNEGDATAAITVLLSAASGKTVTVHYQTANGTASAGSDYTAAGGELTFSPGQTSRDITVPLLNDATDEPPETFLLDINSPVNALLGTPAQSTITIQDNDPAPAIQFSSAAYEIMEGQGQAVVTVQLTQASALPVQVHYAVTSGTATGGTTPAGSDFLLTEGDLSFSPGQAARTFTIQIVDDAKKEHDETALLALSGPVNAAPGTPITAQLVIHDNDPLPVVSFSQASYNAVENDGTAAVTVTLSSESDDPVTVDYATSDQTGEAGRDYVSANGTLTFPPGTTSHSFTVALIDDSMDNENKTVNLVLRNPGGATLANPLSAATLNIQDDDPAPTVQFAEPSVQVSESAGSVTLTVKLSTASEKTVSVSYHVTGGSAQAGADYTGGEGTLVFAPGELTQSFTMNIIDNAQYEPGELIHLALFDIENAAAGKTITFDLAIVDDDPAEYHQYLPIVLYSN